MKIYTNEELAVAVKVVSSTIRNCEKIQPKFQEGTSQHTLLKNRIKALKIARFIIAGESSIGQYTKDELIYALRPVSSIISKCEKAQMKFLKESPHYFRLEKMIKAMSISKSYITDEISKKEE